MGSPYKNLEIYIDRQNAFAKIFKRKEYDFKDLSAEDVKDLYNALECDLSPENLCCDGELPQAEVIRKARHLNAAMEELSLLAVR